MICAVLIGSILHVVFSLSKYLLKFSKTVLRHINSFGVKAVYIQPFHKPICVADTPRTPRALDVVGSIPGVSVTLFLHFFCFRARLARKCERIDPRVDFYSTPSCITIVKSLNR